MVFSGCLAPAANRDDPIARRRWGLDRLRRLVGAGLEDLIDLAVDQVRRQFTGLIELDRHAPDLIAQRPGAQVRVAAVLRPRQCLGELLTGQGFDRAIPEQASASGQLALTGSATTGEGMPSDGRRWAGSRSGAGGVALTAVCPGATS